MFWFRRKIPQYSKDTKKVLCWIRWWEKKHPEEEMVFITLPKYDQEERNQRIRMIAEQLEKEHFTQP